MANSSHAVYRQNEGPAMFALCAVLEHGAILCYNSQFLLRQLTVGRSSRCIFHEWPGRG